MRIRLGTFIFLAVLIATLLGGIFGEKASADTQPDKEQNEKLLKIFTEVLARVEKDYVNDVSTESLIENAIQGMLRTLDPHSSFFTTKDYDRLQEEQKGKYYGLGITIRAEAPGSGRVVVVEPPAPGTPAFKAGLRAGDIIAKIEGQPIDDWDINTEVIPNLKGPKGTQVNITVERPGVKEPLDFMVERDEIPMYTIKYSFRIRPGIGYIRIARFAETTGEELDRALESLDEKTLKGLILDLRNNPGGALTQALVVSDRFLDKGQMIVRTKTRNGNDDNYRARRDAKYDYPMVVLINQNSASASEIVSGALQDHDRALILGQTSFGKALVQTIYPIEGHRGLALTTGKYYTPSDRLIQRDYSGSFWDYYNNRSSESSESPNSSDLTKYFTDGGRIVYGGGGISPDVKVELNKPNRVIRRIRGHLFRDFASKLYTGSVKTDIQDSFPQGEAGKFTNEEIDEVIRNLWISDRTLSAFRIFLKENDLDLSAEDLEENRKVISNLIKQELLLLLLGDEASYKVALDLDKQVLTAIERLPFAQSLLDKKLVQSDTGGTDSF